MRNRHDGTVGVKVNASSLLGQSATSIAVIFAVAVEGDRVTASVSETHGGDFRFGTVLLFLLGLWSFVTSLQRETPMRQLFGNEQAW